MICKVCFQYHCIDCHQNNPTCESAARSHTHARYRKPMSTDADYTPARWDTPMQFSASYATGMYTSAGYTCDKY